MRETKLRIWLSQEELVGVVEALASFPITRPEHSHPYLRAYNAFRRATADQFFEPTLENLKAALRALVSHSDRVAPQRRDAIERAASKIASCAPAPSDPRTDVQAREVFINRHPIFESNLNPFAYELLAQRKQTSGSAPGYLVVIRAMLDKFTEQGLHQLVGDKPSFISVSWEAVVRGHCQALPKQRVVLELLDGADPDETLFQALAKLSKDVSCLYGLFSRPQHVVTTAHGSRRPGLLECGDRSSEAFPYRGRAMFERRPSVAADDCAETQTHPGRPAVAPY